MDWFYYNPVAIYAGTDAFIPLAQQLGSFQKILLLTSPGMVRRGSALKLIEALSKSLSKTLEPTASGSECSSPLQTSFEGGFDGSLKQIGAGSVVIEMLQGKQRKQGKTSEWVVATMGPNPDVLTLQGLVEQLIGKGIDAIVAFGGGSVMDSAKVLATALASNSKEPFDIRYFFSHHDEETPFLPYYCVPTTSGTGAEVTPFGTIWDTESLKKYSFSAKNLFATGAFLHPSTTVSLPPKETLYGAMDTMSHALETLWNRNSSTIGLSFARRAITAVCEAYPLVENNPHDRSARLCLQEASTLAGLAISQSRSALAHSMSYPLTSHYGVPHGLACSFTLPAIIDLVTARNLWQGEEDATLALRAAVFIRNLRLQSHVLEYCSEEEVLALAGEMFAPGRVENFIVPITSADVVAILQESLDFG